jgi:hypothetical protein
LDLTQVGDTSFKVKYEMGRRRAYYAMGKQLREIPPALSVKDRSN